MEPPWPNVPIGSLFRPVVYENIPITLEFIVEMFDFTYQADPAALPGVLLNNVFEDAPPAGVTFTPVVYNGTVGNSSRSAWYTFSFTPNRTNAFSFQTQAYATNGQITQWNTQPTILAVVTPTPTILGSQANTGVWNTSAWSNCDRTCGGGYQLRSVYCVRNNTYPPDSGSWLYGGAYCDSTPPPAVQSCNMQNCTGFHWQASVRGWDYSSCYNQCGGALRRNNNKCVQSNGVTVSNINCQGLTPPITSLPCHVGAQCYWKRGGWGTCGAAVPGQQVQKVACWDKWDNDLYDSSCNFTRPAENRTCLSAATINPSAQSISTSSTTLTITGTNFDPNDPNGNFVIITTTKGALPTYTVSSANSTALVVTLTSTMGVDVVDAVWSASVDNGNNQFTSSVIITSPITLQAPTVDPSLIDCSTDVVNYTITGTFFHPNLTRNMVKVTGVQGTPGPATNVIYVDPTGTTLTFVLMSGLPVGLLAQGEYLLANVNNSFFASGDIPITSSCLLGVPVVNSSLQAVSTDSAWITITGVNFNPNAVRNFAYFTSSAGSPPIGVVTSVNPAGTLLNVSFVGRLNTDLLGATLSAMVSNGRNSTVTPVTGAITLGSPLVTFSNTTFITTSLTLIQVNGLNFHPNGSQNVLNITASSGTPPIGVVTSVLSGGTSILINFTTVWMDLVGAYISISVSTGAGVWSSMTRVTDVILLASPTLNTAATFLATNSTSLDISGSSFNYLNMTANNVSLTPAGGVGTIPSYTVTNVSKDGTSATIRFSQPLGSDLVGRTINCRLTNGNGDTVGTSTRIVTALVVLSPPFVNTAGTIITTDNTTLTITGHSFNITASEIL